MTKPWAPNPRQARFIVEYLRDRNGKQAAIRAGYSPRHATVRGAALLANANVRALVNEKLNEQQDRLQVKADDVLRELMRVALCDIAQVFDEGGRLKPIHQIGEEARRAISSVEVLEARGEEDGVVRKIRFWSKLDALDKLGKHLRLFGEQTPQRPEESAEKLRSLLAEMDQADGFAA